MKDPENVRSWVHVVVVNDVDEQVCIMHRLETPKEALYRQHLHAHRKSPPSRASYPPVTASETFCLSPCLPSVLLATGVMHVKRVSEIAV